MAQEHTPTPWRATDGRLIRVFPVGSDTPICGVHRRRRSSTRKDAEAEAIANAAYIAHCVNAHQALVDACNAVVEWLGEPIEAGMDLEHETINPAYRKAVYSLRAALKLAEGK